MTNYEQKVIKTMERIDEFRAVVASLQEYQPKDVTGIYAEYGRKYCKISVGNIIHCFINLDNGDILKAATYKAPAKHARGNIFSEDCGRSAITQYGANYIIR